MLFLKFVEVCYVPDESFIVELVNSSVTSYDVHCLSAEEVHELSLYLGRTSRLIRTECLCFLFVSDQLSAAVRACLREVGK